MASTSPLCRADRLQRRAGLVVRPIPEIGLCMVYRPRPAKIVTLNTASWLLFAACGGEVVEDIVIAVQQAQQGQRRPMAFAEALQGLQALVDLGVVCRPDSCPNSKEPSHD
jgi:hypothetical protein